MADYIALIHKDADSDYSVSFPDFPGCITAGVTLDEARAMAAEALAFHVQGMREDGAEIPAPSPMAEIMRERENRDAVAFLVTLPGQAERHLRVQITLAEGIVREIDALTDNRSKFLAEAAGQVLRGRAALRATRRKVKRGLGREVARKLAKKARRKG